MDKKKKRHGRVAILSILATIISLEYLGLIYPSLRSRFFYFLARIGRSLSSRKSLEERREAMDHLGRVILQESNKLQTVPVYLDTLLVEWILPETENDPSKVILYLHGGAYVQKTPEFHKRYTKSIADGSGIRVLMVDYRLAPEHPFPAALEDAASAYQWLVAQGYKSHNIALAGDSAGGGLAAATVIQSREKGEELPSCVVMLSPWLDLAGRGNSIVRLAKVDAQLNWKNLQISAKSYYGDFPPDFPLISPLYANLRGFPPTLIITGGHEILLDDSIRFADRAVMSNVDIELIVAPKMGHAWSIFQMVIPEAEKANEVICNFIQKNLE
ncbi:MAG: alpha/beta hydrolase [Anaerolineaceae bacterium]|nr:alpha/beta hydrolase [Anaerolineaceae bacterium]